MEAPKLSVFTSTLFLSTIFVVSYAAKSGGACAFVYAVRALPRARWLEKDLLRQHVTVFIVNTYLLLPSVTRLQFAALDCVTIAGGSFLREDTSVDCTSAGYKTFRVLDGLLIALFQTLPLMYMALLCEVRGRLNPPTAKSEAQKLAIRDRDASLAAITFLFEDYVPNRWWFEVADMYRRMLIVW